MATVKGDVHDIGKVSNPVIANAALLMSNII